MMHVHITFCYLRRALKEKLVVQDSALPREFFVRAPIDEQEQNSA